MNRLFFLLCLLISISLSSWSHAEPTTSSERIAAPLPTLLKTFKRHPDSAAEVITRNTQITVDDNYFSHTASYVAVYINSDEAVRDYSQISISFNSFYEDIALEFANVRTPEGEMDSIKPDATQIQSPTDENFYHDRKELLFSLPNVRKGSVIEFQYRYTDTKKIIDHQWFDSFSLHWWEDRAANQGSRADAVALAEFSITAPKGMNFYSNDLSSLGITKTQKDIGNKTVINWQGKNLPKITLQDYMPRTETRAYQLRISTMSSWSQVANWANTLFEPHLITDTALDKLIDEITKKAITPEQKVKGVYQALQENIRYVFAHVGRGGYEPHNAADVLKNGYGDCKDQTILAVVMLRKLGIRADAALLITRSRGIPNMTIPGVSFDHMIVHIPEQTGLQETWFDTSGDLSLFPGFSIGLEGQPSLIINKDTKDIVTIPSLTSDKHFVHFDLIFDKFEDERAEANFTLKLGGIFEQRLRGMWQFSRERDKTFRETLSRIFPTADVTDLKINNADNLWQSLNINGRYLYKNVWTNKKENLSYSFSIIQLISLFTNLRDLHKPQDRTEDFSVDTAYTLSTHLVLTRPSPEYIATVERQGQNFDNAYFSLTQKGHEEDGNYIIDQTLVIKANTIPIKDYPRYYELVHQLLESSEWAVNYHQDKTAMQIASLQSAINGKEKTTDFVALVKLYIKQGAYSKALEAANQAIAKNPTSGEAFYVLGLAQGYNNLLSESDKSFAKAEQLGYSL